MKVTEVQIRRGVVSFLRNVGYAVWDTEQGYRQGGTRITKGLPDLFFIGHGEHGFVELKTEKGTLTLEQRQFRETAKQNNVPYYLWRSSEDAYEHFERVRAAVRKSGD